jgi:hypothetical protein
MILSRENVIVLICRGLKNLVLSSFNSCNVELFAACLPDACHELMLYKYWAANQRLSIMPIWKPLNSMSVNRPQALPFAEEKFHPTLAVPHLCPSEDRLHRLAGA